MKVTRTEKILFIAEAPGSNGKHFYRMSTNLFRTLRASFEQVFGTFDSAEEFLAFFTGSGCVLEHLRSTTSELSKVSPDGDINRLAKIIAGKSPENLIVLMKRILPEVKRAALLADIKLDKIKVTSYPAGNEINRQTCIRDVSSWLRSIFNLDDL